MSALGDLLRKRSQHLLDGTDLNDLTVGHAGGLWDAAGMTDEHFAAALAEAAVLRGPFAAAVLRAAAERLDASVPEDVFTPNGTTVDAHSARVRRIDAGLLRRWASEVDE